MPDIQSEIDAVARIELINAPSLLGFREQLVGKIPPEYFDSAERDFQMACVQERAGVAFRSASEGNTFPDEYGGDFHPVILGILRRYQQADWRLPEFELQKFNSVELINRSVEALFTCCAPNGAIAAAPNPRSSTDPNYWFFWQRDAAHIAIALAEATKQSHLDDKLRVQCCEALTGYVNYCQEVQKNVPIELLGVSRFTMDGEPIVAYGNPQQDGPALTALALLSARDVAPESCETAVPFLNYLCSEYSWGPGFDPWEFSVGQIFYGKNLARRALRAARLASINNQNADAYADREAELHEELRSFWNSNYIPAGKDLLVEAMFDTTQLDISVIGSALICFDSDDEFLNVDDEHMIATMQAIENAYVDKWPVNLAWQECGQKGFGIGRFPEDMNDGFLSTGGNPWTLATLWAAQYYLALAERMPIGNSSFDTAPLLEKANGFLSFVISAHGPLDGDFSLHEQIDGFTGKPRGAWSLGWAWAELCRALCLSSQVP